MKSSEGNSSERKDSLKGTDVLVALRQMDEFGDDKALKILQGLLDSCSRGLSGDFSSWQLALIELVKLIINGNIQDQSALLSGQIFLSILSKITSPQHVESHLKSFLGLKSDNLVILGENFVVKDRENFQLIIINNCLSVNKQKFIFSREIYCLMFEIIENHCVLYTRHTYLAFRLLNNLLECTKMTNYWQDDEFEEKLEKIIMSNWDNCISDVGKLNATGIFPKYLNIISRKYPTFLEKSFDLLINQLSWHNPTKYTILTEIFKAMKTPPCIEDHHILEIVESLSRSHLKYPSTKFYLAVWSNLDEKNWLEFYKLTHPTIKSWEMSNKTSPLRFIWELWFRPTLKKFSKNIFYDLWDFLFKEEMLVSQSFLVKFAVARGIELTSLLKNEKSKKKNVKNIWIKRGESGVPFVLEDERECVRINGFFIYCSGTVFRSEEEFNDFIDNDSSSLDNENFVDYKICENFLYFNARAASVNMRKEIMDNFKGFIEKILRTDDDDDRGTFLQHLHEFIRNCFELGSCYQRRIMGLGLYEIILQSLKNPEIIEKKSFHEFRKKIENIEISHDLIRLCLDPVDDVREKSCSILCTHFTEKITPEEAKILFQQGMKCCRSSKFYEVSGGGKLLKVFIKTTGEDLSKCLYKEMKLQLSAMRRDILKATAQGSPFYGAIIALLEINFDKNSANSIKINEEFAMDLLNVLEEASVFFLSSLSPRSEETKYSASFAEMGIAIEERINSSEIRITKYEECALSPAHQTILSCIWMSLASICNLAGELTHINTEKRCIYTRSIDIVVKILMKCRHKGVIEVAGVVLVRLMKNKNIDYTYFIKYLEDLLSLDADDSINLTRRGAGQSIMFHKFIANDERKSRPLLQTAMQKIFMNLQNNSLKLEARSDENSKQDNPLARQLHFLHRIVSDKCLHPHLIEYIEEIALKCLHHSTSPEWSIRNASLQLLGAVIPRVVGQFSDGELDFSTGYSIQHFLTHYPNLAKRILQYLRENTNSEVTMPILTLLSKMRVSGCDYIDYSSEEYKYEITREIQLLFEHPVAAVRNLAAKTFATLIPAYGIGETIFCMANSNFDNCNDNYRHSYFSALMYLQIRAKQEFLKGSARGSDGERIRDGINRQLERLNDFFRRWCENEDFNVNYIVEASFIKSVLASNQLGKCSTSRFVISPQGHEAIRNKIGGEEKRQGFWEFIDHLVQVHWFFMDFHEDSGNSYCVFNDIDRYSIFMMKYAEKRIVKEDGSEKQKILLPLLKKICKIIENSQFQAYFPIIFGFIVKILGNEESRTIRESNLSSLITEIIKKLVESGNDLLQRLGYSLAANHQFTQFNDEKSTKKALDFISNSIKNGDEVGKLWALDCLKNFLKNTKFVDIEDFFKLRIIESLVVLLNDQVPEIRSCIDEKMMFFEMMPFQHKFPLSKNSEIYLYQVLKSSVKNSCPLELNSKLLEDLIASVMNNNRNLDRDMSGDITSPFEHDELYREDGKIINVLTEFISSSNVSSPLINDTLHISRINAIGNSYQENYIAKLMETHSHKLSAILNMNIGEYLSYKIQTLKNIIKGDEFT